MKKKSLLYLLFFIPIAASADDRGTCGENLSWEYVEASNTLTISGNGEINNNACHWDRFRDKIKKVIIKDGVTSIGSSVFSGCYSLTSVIIPNSVTSVGDYAFGVCVELTSVSIGTGVRTIGYRAFLSCIKLSSLVLPESLTTMSEDVFFDCRLLEELFYLSPTAPKNWVATTRTYVPDKQSYTLPTYSINNAEVVELIQFNTNKFKYSGLPPKTDWINNAIGYDASLSLSKINYNVGEHEAWVPVTLAKENEIVSCNVVFRYTIESTPLIIKANNLSRIYGDENPTLSVSYYGFVNGEREDVLEEAPSISTTATKTSDVGDYPITISGGNAKNYTIACEPGILTIKEAPLTAKVKDETKQYCQDNPEFTIIYTGMKNGETMPKWKEPLQIITSAIKTSDVGTYTISAFGVPVNYNLVGIENGTLTITQAPLTIKADNAKRRYFEDEPIFSFSVIGLLNNDDIQVLSKLPDITTKATKTSPVGKYAIIAQNAAAKNYAISYEQGELSINKRALKVTSHGSREYGEKNPIFKLEYEGFVNNENVKVIAVKPTATTTATIYSKVGEYPITINGGEATNYDFNYEQGVLTITKAPLSAKVNDATKVYGKENPQFTIKYTGLKNNESKPEWAEELKIKTSATTSSDVGTYAITASGTPVNYELPSIESGKLTITKASLTIQANDATRRYYDVDSDYGYSCLGLVTDDDIVLSKEPTITTDATRTSSVGEYKTIPSGAEARNYTISYAQGKLTIIKRPLNVTSNCSREYGEDNPTLPISYEGFVNNENETVIAVSPVASTTATKSSKVGDYPITVNGGSATNYEFVYSRGTLTITKAPLSAKVNDATKVYGEHNPTFSIDYNGLKNGETAPAWITAPTFRTEAATSSNVGQYAVTAKDGVPVNYDLHEIMAGTLNVTPASLTITANDATRQYYSDNPTFSYICNGFVNNEDESVLAAVPTLSTSATKTSDVGDYQIEVSGTSSKNYDISFVSGTLSVTPRTLIASVGNYERAYNEDNPAFEVTYDGFVGNETEDVLKTRATASTPATKTTDVGSYPIYVTGGAADNYRFSYNSGTLTIHKAEQSITWGQDFRNLKVGDQVELKATATSGLEITYSLDDNHTAEIYMAGTKFYLDCKAEGETQIVAVQDGNKNYYSSTRIRKPVVVGDGDAIHAIETSDMIIQGTPFGIRVTNAEMGETIDVYSLNGVLLKSLKVEEQTMDILLPIDNVYLIKVGGKMVKLKL